MRGRVLVIAGSDSGGGAGIQADIKAIMAMGAFSATAITALTVQNTLGVHAILPVAADFVRQQIAAVLDDIGADAIKIGMLGDDETIAEVVDALSQFDAEAPLVLDPVMVAKGGARLLPPSAVEAVRHTLIPRAALLTPNIPEAEILLGRPVGNPIEAASALLDLGARAVLLKGGHAGGPMVRDVLAHQHGIETFDFERIETRHTHGTGCTLASAIAAGLAQGMPLVHAIGRARRYVQAAIRTAPGLGGGHGPLNHGATPDPPP